MRKAFTLIELLVVIAIIAILAAILFPVFAQAKAAAKQTASLSGLKQLALGLQMYSGDSDDMSVPYYGYAPVGAADQDQYHYNDTWAGRIYPYVKNNSIYFDKDFGQINDYTQLYQDPVYPSDTFYTYAWSWITTFSINATGYSVQEYSGSDCQSGDYSSQPETPRSLTAISSVADRLALTPTRYATIPNFSWMYFTQNASWPTADAYATGYSQYQLVFDARKQYSTKFLGAYADGHAARYDTGKFVKYYANGDGTSEATTSAEWCTQMDTRNLWNFWGPFWTGN